MGTLNNALWYTARTTHGSADRSPARTRPRRSSESLGGGCGGSASGSCWRHSVTVMSSDAGIGGNDNSGGRRMSRRDGARAAGGGVSTNGARHDSATDLRRPRLVDALRTARPYNRISLRDTTQFTFGNFELLR